MSKAIHTRFIEIAGDLSPELAEEIASSEPLQLVPCQDVPFPERLCRAIAGQQLSIKAAETIWGRVVGSASSKSLMDHFSAVEPTVLRTCGLSAAKVKAVRAVAQTACTGQLDAEELRGLDHRDRTQRLTAIWGVGQWTADMMGIFYFGDPDIWPEGDVTARKTLEKLTSSRRKTICTA
ncbi:MAG: DNA-3-methyladenine glycosylase 2 family protein, partial [Leptolyngbya sp. SIO1D8]|nr:DNA-3-methyladenine glycosylase 2 family protein [Leptolyngbya sp. SIO1D8]